MNESICIKLAWTLTSVARSVFTVCTLDKDFMWRTFLTQFPCGWINRSMQRKCEVKYVRTDVYEIFCGVGSEDPRDDFTAGTDIQPTKNMSRTLEVA